jgi:excisionase family DNA binding protein
MPDKTEHRALQGGGPSPAEARAARELLQQMQQQDAGQKRGKGIKITFETDGYQNKYDLPSPVAEALLAALDGTAHGQAVAILPENMELSTQEAANFLNVSRPYLVGLLKKGDLPYRKVGTHRRVPIRALAAYKAIQDSDMEQAILMLMKESQEMGLYDQ